MRCPHEPFLWAVPMSRGCTLLVRCIRTPTGPGKGRDLKHKLTQTSSHPPEQKRPTIPLRKLSLRLVRVSTVRSPGFLLAPGQWFQLEATHPLLTRSYTPLRVNALSQYDSHGMSRVVEN